jgi:O-antigen/teichoic acid export membrane protein
MSVDIEDPIAAPAGGAPRTSVAAGSVARSAAEATWAAFALLTGVIAARHLGPVGKGTVSSIGYLVALVAPAVTLGLGEAGVTLARGRGTDLRRVVGTTISWLIVASVVGAAVLVGLLALQFRGDLSILRGATMAAVASVPAMAVWLVFSLFVEAEGGLIASAAIKVLVGAVTAVASAVLVLGFELAQAGAVAGMAAGFVAGAVATTAWLWIRRGVAPVPRWDPGYLRAAIAVGLPIVGSYLLLGTAARLDLLIVQGIKGSEDAGLYSVALTMGQLVFYGPVAVAVASYGVAAGLGAGDVVAFIERAGRTGVAAGVVCAVALVPILPVLMPAMFGIGFKDAVTMALVLLPASVLQGLQWVICRLWAARGRGTLLLTSCGAMLVAMIALDIVLVPAHGGIGAAVASLVASAVGAAVALAGHRRRAGGDASLRHFVPHVADFRRIAELPRAVWARIAGRATA